MLASHSGVGDGGALEAPSLSTDYDTRRPVLHLQHRKLNAEYSGFGRHAASVPFHIYKGVKGDRIRL